MALGVTLEWSGEAGPRAVQNKIVHKSMKIRLQPKSLAIVTCIQISLGHPSLPL